MFAFLIQAEDGIRDESVTGVQTDRKSTRLNSSHTLISYAVSLDRKSTRLHSSHTLISYAVFCLKKKKHNSKHSLLPPYAVPSLISPPGGDCLSYAHTQTLPLVARLPTACSGSSYMPTGLS